MFFKTNGYICGRMAQNNKKRKQDLANILYARYFGQATSGLASVTGSALHVEHIRPISTEPIFLQNLIYHTEDLQNSSAFFEIFRSSLEVNEVSARLYSADYLLHELSARQPLNGECYFYNGVELSLRDWAIEYLKDSGVLSSRQDISQLDFASLKKLVQKFRWQLFQQFCAKLDKRNALVSRLLGRPFVSKEIHKHFISTIFKSHSSSSTDEEDHKFLAENNKNFWYNFSIEQYEQERKGNTHFHFKEYREAA